MGEAPLWYSIIKASKYLGVPPWELIEQPREWFEMAMTAESAEAVAAAERHQRASKKKK